MESRYHEFAQRGVRNIAGYNEALRSRASRGCRTSSIVIDELADLMMVSAYEVEATITRIAQLARATGIHLVVATQRPIGAGHHRPDQGQHPEPHRLRHDQRRRLAHDPRHGRAPRTCWAAATCSTSRSTRRARSACRACWSPTSEIETVAAPLAGAGRPAVPAGDHRAASATARPGGRPGEEDDDGDAAPLLSQAVDIVRRSDKASASLLQRRLRIGYARAARILDQMEDRGIVGPADGSRFREVLVTPRWLGRRRRPGRGRA